MIWDLRIIMLFLTKEHHLMLYALILTRFYGIQSVIPQDTYSPCADRAKIMPKSYLGGCNRT